MEVPRLVDREREGRRSRPDLAPEEDLDRARALGRPRHVQVGRAREQPVELAGRDAGRSRRRARASTASQQRGDAAPALRRDEDDGRPRQELEVSRTSRSKAALCEPRSPARSHLLTATTTARARLDHFPADRRVHLAQPRLGVEHQHRDVRARDRAPRLHDAHVVDVLLQQAHAPDARGVDQPVAAARASRTASSTASRVVPGTAETTARSLPSSRLRIDDLPTFGRPTSATRTGGFASGSGSTTGRPSSAASSRSPIPRPCSAEIGVPSPQPRRANSRDVLRLRPRPCSRPDAPACPRGAAAARSPRRPAAARRARPRRAARRRLRRSRAPPGASPGPSRGSSLPEQQAARVDELEGPALPARPARSCGRGSSRAGRR